MEFKFCVAEHNIGVADDSRLITVQAFDIKSALKKLRRYLANQYEDTLTYSPHAQWRKSGELAFNAGWLRAHLHRNAGHLTIVRLPQ